MANTKELVPFVIKATRINNYTHFITLLKLKQKKYKEFPCAIVNHLFSKVLSVDKEQLGLDDIIEGFLHQKLKEHAETHETDVFNGLNAAISRKISELKSENDLKVHGLKIGNLKDVESQLFSKPSVITFKDGLLYDLYEFLKHEQDPLSFLHDSYFKFIRKFFTDNKYSNISRKSNIEDIIEIVKEYVKIRFNRDEYGIEAYESRYLWAEIFVLYRIGREDAIKKLLNEYELFFEFMASKFKSCFASFLDGKKYNFNIRIAGTDKFQRFLFDIIDEKAQSDGIVISTVEDYLWLKIISDQNIKTDIDYFDNNKIRFMIAILSNKYRKAIDILLKSEFNIISKFFLLRELCFEKQYDKQQVETDSKNIFDKSNKFTRSQELKNKIYVEESSDTFSMVSANEPNYSSINVVFMNFLFAIVSKLSSKEYKVKMIEMLKNHSDYYNTVPIYIIKYSLFDILGKKQEKINEVEYALDDKLASMVLEKLKENGDKQRMIQLSHLIDDITMVQLLIDTVEEAILIDIDVDTSIVEKYINRSTTKDCEKLRNVYDFYKFYKSPSFVTLRSTVLFTQNINLIEYKFIIEKIFYKAVEIIKADNNQLMAKSLFKLCGLLSLDESCISKITKDLVTFL